MDSLITSAIALAAGGWQNVKLAGMYYEARTSIPTWKIGLFQLLSCRSDAASASNAWGTSIVSHPITAIIIPGSTFREMGTISSNQGNVSCSSFGGYVSFKSTSIEEKSISDTWCAILFTWS